MYVDLTQGNITKSLIKFTIPLILGNLLQQLYNITDTIIVGKFIGSNALASVGSAYTLMTFLTSIILGLCMGCGVVFSIKFGEKNEADLKQSMYVSFILISVVTVIITLVSYLFTDEIMVLLKVPSDIVDLLKEYLLVIFSGIVFIFIYNYFACLLRAVGNSVVPLIFLGISTVVNIVLDIVFIVEFNMGVFGAGFATVIAQVIAGIGISLYTMIKFSELKINRQNMFFSKRMIREISKYSVLTCIQQSVMNFGILMVQGLVNSFGTAVMAGFASGVKIDAFAYMPLQDFGNAFSTFIAQNFGANKKDRIRKSIFVVLKIVFVFSMVISLLVFIFAEQLIMIFVNANETEIIKIGATYLRIEGVFYLGIGILFCLYGFYRAISKPFMSLVLTIISLGLRVVLAYILSGYESIGIIGIWVAVPIGWLIADIYGILFYIFSIKKS